MNDEVTLPDGSDLKPGGLKVGDKILVNGALMYVSDMSAPMTTDGIATHNFELSALPPDFLAEALYRSERFAMNSRDLMLLWLNENVDLGNGGASAEEVMQTVEQSSWLAERDEQLANAIHEQKRLTLKVEQLGRDAKIRNQMLDRADEFIESLKAQLAAKETPRSHAVFIANIMEAVSPVVRAEIEKAWAEADDLKSQLRVSRQEATA